MAIKSISDKRFKQYGNNLSHTDDLVFLNRYNYEERSPQKQSDTYRCISSVYMEKLGGQSVINLSSNGKDFSPFYFDGPVMLKAGTSFNFTPLTKDFLYCIYYEDKPDVIKTAKSIPTSNDGRRISCKRLMLCNHLHMPEGLCFRPEAQPFWELDWYMRGTFERTIDGKTCVIQSPAYSFIPANSLHSLKTNEEDVDFLAIIFEMECSEAQKLTIPRKVTSEIKHFLQRIMERIGDDSPYNEECILSLISVVVAETLSTELEEDESAKLSVTAMMQMNEVAARAERIIDENIFNPELSVSFVARNLFISNSYLYRCSMNRYGVGISEHIHNRKLEMACELLRNSKYSLSDIASNLNFCSQSYFSTRFKKRYGMSPLQYSSHINREDK